MEKSIEKIVLRMFPELSGNYHLPRFARVIAISDPMEKPEINEKFRPRYAVDIQVLTASGDDDSELPLYQCVPLPVLSSGIERGQFGFPDPGAIVEVAFAYGLPDQLFIRSVLGVNQGMPELNPGDLVWQHSEAVKQKVSNSGHWIRKTHGNINDSCRVKISKASSNQEHYQNTHQQVAEHSTEEVAGIKLIEALGALKLLSGGSVNLSAVDNLNLTTATDLNQVVGRDRLTTINENDKSEVGVDRVSNIGNDDGITIGGDKTETIAGDEQTTIDGNRTLSIAGNDNQTSGERTVSVAGNHTDTATANRNIQAAIIQLQASVTAFIAAPSITLQAPTIAIGSGGVDLLQVLSQLIAVVQQLATTTAGHTHLPNGMPSTQSDHTGQAVTTGVLATQLNTIMPSNP
ncbi:MAG: hypothetical protein JKY93_02060 [Gammaproteobacteria bacterium]|nr:hypothetical protein [Gammaproteobacteria bacterium]